MFTCPRQLLNWSEYIKIIYPNINVSFLLGFIDFEAFSRWCHSVHHSQCSHILNWFLWKWVTSRQWHQKVAVRWNFAFTCLGTKWNVLFKAYCISLVYCFYSSQWGHVEGVAYIQSSKSNVCPFQRIVNIKLMKRLLESCTFLTPGNKRPIMEWSVLPALTHGRNF